MKRKHRGPAVNSLENVNIARKQNGLPEIVHKWIQCLNCVREFKSTGFSHRLCERCQTPRNERP